MRWPRSQPGWPTASSVPSSRRCAAPWGRRSSPAPTWSSRPARGPGSPWPTWCRPCSAATRWWWPPPPRHCRTSWRRRTCPLVERGLASTFSYAVLKGRSNYICRQRVAEVGSGGIQPELGGEAGGEAESFEPDAARTESAPAGLVDEVRTLLAWSDEHDERATGPICSFEPSGRAWGMVSVGPRECPGAFNCPSGEPVLRRGRPGPGGGGRRGGGQHPPLRRPPGQRAGRAARARCRDLRRDPRARGGDDRRAWGSRSPPAASAPWPPRPAPWSATRGRGRHGGVAVLGGRPDRRPAGRPGGDPGPARRCPPAGRRPRAGRAARPAADWRAGSPTPSAGATCRAPCGGGRVECGTGGARKTRAISAASHLTDDLHRLMARGRRRCRLGRRHAAQRAAAALPDRCRAGALARPVGEVTAVLTSATVPPRLVERVGLEGFETNQLNVGSPFDYRAHCAPLRGSPPARPPGPTGRGGAP